MARHPRQVLDVHQARLKGPTPVLLFIHGGGWMNGDKGNPDFLDRCLENGISAVSINYRLIPNAIEARIDPPVKACLDDAARALQFTRSKAAEWHLDKTRIAGCGGSAGGFTSLWLAYQSRPRRTPRVTILWSVNRRAWLACWPSCRRPHWTRSRCTTWIPNNDYGHHAFALPSMADFIAKRESLMPWIKRFSPYELATADDPPV